MGPTLIDLRAKAKQDLAEWYHNTVIQPFIDGARAAGFSDEETNILFNIAMQGRRAWDEKPY